MGIAIKIRKKIIAKNYSHRMFDFADLLGSHALKLTHNKQIHGKGLVTLGCVHP